MYVLVKTPLDAIKILSYYSEFRGREVNRNLPDSIYNAVETIIDICSSNRHFYSDTFLSDDLTSWLRDIPSTAKRLSMDEWESSVDFTGVYNRFGNRISDPKIISLGDRNTIIFDFCEKDDHEYSLGVHICYDCGRVHDCNDDLVIADKHVCSSCAENYWACEVCGKLTRNREHLPNEDGSRRDVYIHRSCVELSEKYMHCRNCGKWILANTDEDGYCDSCKYRSYAHDYSYKPDPVFYKTGTELRNNDTAMYFGCEIELEFDDDCSEDTFLRSIYETVKNFPEFYAKHDGSLNAGEEFVTHPMTLEYMKSTNVFRKFMANAQSQGFYDDDTCGLHVHCNRKFFGDDWEVIAKILMLIDFNRDNVVKFSRRSESRLEEWAQILCLDKVTDIEMIAKIVNGSSRYSALNVQNRATIEFRIFSCARNEYDILCAVEFCKGMIEYAMNHSAEECAIADFGEIFSNCTPMFDHYCTECGID